MAFALDGVDLLLIALFFLLWATLYATKWTLVPLLSTLHKALGWVPYLGGLVSSAEHAVISAINDGINGTEDAITTLWHGLLWSFELVGKGLRELADLTEQTWNAAVDTWIPNALDAVHDAAVGLVSDVKVDLRALERTVISDAKAAERWAKTEASLALSSAEHYADAAVDAAAAQFREAIHAAEAALTWTATEAAQAAEAGAESLARQLHAAESAALDALADAEGATAGELRDLLGNLQPVDVAAILSSVVLLRAAVQALEAETGLGKQECRDKVRGICTTVPSRWAHFLEGMLFTLTWPGLDDFAQGLADITDEVSTIIVDFLGIA